MHGYFFTHTVWYLLLALFSIAAFTAAIIKSDNRKFTLAFTLAVVGLFYIFEYTLVMTDAYSYSPKVFNEPFLDTVLGNIFSQTSIASITAFIIAYRLKWFWYFVFAAAYYGIERLFVGLGIFETYWYKTIYTPLILVPLFWVLVKWHDRAENYGRKIEVVLLHTLAALAVYSNLVTFPITLLGLRLFTGGFFPNPYQDNTATGLFVTIILLSAMVGIYRSNWRWYWKGGMLAGLFGLKFAAWKAGLMVYREGWFVWVTLISLVMGYAIVCQIGRLVKARTKY